jgi:hypothetical protein
MQNKFHFDFYLQFPKIGFVSGVYSPIITGIFGFIIPAFSKAIFSNVLPKNCV